MIVLLGEKKRFIPTWHIFPMQALDIFYVRMQKLTSA